MKKFIGSFVLFAAGLNAAELPTLGTGVAYPQHGTEMQQQPALLADAPRAATLYGGYAFLLRSAAGSGSYHQAQGDTWGWGVTVDTLPLSKSYSTSAGAGVKLFDKLRAGGSLAYINDLDGGRVYGNAGTILNIMKDLDFGLTATNIGNSPWNLKSGVSGRYWKLRGGFDVQYLPEEKRTWLEPSLAFYVLSWLDVGGKIRVPVSSRLSQVFVTTICIKPMEKLQVYLGFASQYSTVTLAASYFF